MGNQTLFRDRDLFEIDHLPETFTYRDAQVEDLAFALRPALDGATPLNTVLRGLPGTGKTTAVRRLFAEIGETSDSGISNRRLPAGCARQLAERWAVINRVPELRRGINAGVVAPVLQVIMSRTTAPAGRRCTGR